MFKHSQKSRKAAFAQGYGACVSDLRDYIRSNGRLKPGPHTSFTDFVRLAIHHSPARSTETERPLTVGVILDFLEGRQALLLRDPDVSMALGVGSSPTAQTVAPEGGNGKTVQTVSSKGSSPPLQQPGVVVRSPSRQRSPNVKRQSPPGVTPAPLPHSPPRIAPWNSPSLSPPPLPEPAWPEVSLMPALATTGPTTLSTVLPSVGVKRKRDRDALAELDPRTTGNLHGHNHRHHNGSRKKRGNVNKALSQNRSFGYGNGNEEWNMDIDDENSGREKKRIHKS